MSSTNLKQVAYNQRVLKAEDEIAGINCEIADFLNGFSLAAEDRVIICVNAGNSMKKHEAIIGGQFWQQEDRQMTAVNSIGEGMSNTRESAIMTGAVEAVAWKHANEPEDDPRLGSRMIVYPTDLPQLKEVLESGDPNVDADQGHPSWQSLRSL
jgi:hypothetical protein